MGTVNTILKKASLVWMISGLNMARTCPCATGILAFKEESGECQPESLFEICVAD